MSSGAGDSVLVETDTSAAELLQLAAALEQFAWQMEGVVRTLNGYCETVAAHNAILEDTAEVLEGLLPPQRPRAVLTVVRRGDDG